jgi:uncharacterized protein (TIGR02646 family)
VIHVDRGRTPEPEILRSQLVYDVLERARKHFRAEDSRSRQARFMFDPLQISASVLSSLRKLFASKCAFCESPITSEDRPNVHHLRPQQEAIDKDGRVSRAHYWWLAYAWENLYLTCKTCERACGEQFPVNGRRGVPGASVALLREQEIALLLDPCWDVPERHLVFTLHGIVEPTSEIGFTTIELLKLNREALVRARQLAVENADQLASRITHPDELQPLMAPDQPYAAAVRQALAERRDSTMGSVTARDLSAENTYLESRSTGRVMITGNRPFAEPAPQVTPMTLRRLKIDNIRGIEHLDLDLTLREGPWTMLLGENGHGKSTVLRAIALVLMGEKARARLKLGDLDPWIRHGAAEGQIVAWMEGALEPRTIVLRRGARQIVVEGDDMPAAMAAYGAGRLPMLRDPDHLPRRFRVRPRIESLFDPHTRLMPATRWLLSLDPPTFDYAARAIHRLLSEPDSSWLQQDRDDVLLHRDRGPVSLRDLSDGYRAMLTLAADMMSTFLMRFGTLDAAEGIVLVDELSAHLHPRWQMRIVSAFRQAFPRLQVIATTHDPLCLRGLQDGEVIVLRRDTRTQRLYDLPPDEVPPLRGMRVDELLTSEIFGLNSTIDEELDALYHRYYELLARDGRAPGATDELKFLRAELDRHRQFGTTRRERLALEAADRYVAEEGGTSDPAERAVLSESLRSELRSVWAGD